MTFGTDCTTDYNLRELNNFTIGSLVWGDRPKRYEIIEIIKENENKILDNTYNHIQHPKPPLEVTPKYIFEFQRVQELCRVLHERSIYEEVDYDLMIKWSDELNDRLYRLKGENK